MANQIFNIARGRDVQFCMNVNANAPTNSALIVILLTANEADDVLNNHRNLATLKANNTVATFTGYAPKIIDDTGGITVTINDTTNLVAIDIPDQVWTSAGGATNNTLTKAVICYDGDTTSGTDTDIIPLYHFDVTATTNGNNFTLQINASGLISQ